jgi:hypothetical protein
MLKMAETQGKYDYLITRLLPIHKTLLSITDNKETLIACINELKAYIGSNDIRKANRLDNLLNSLEFPNQNTRSKISEKAVIIICRNSAINILATFLIELDPEED